MNRRLSLLTSLVIALVLAAPASAQVAGASFGVNGGFSTSNFGGTGTNWMGSGTAGLYGAVRTWSYTIVSLEANWAKRGIEESNTSHLEFPLLFGGLIDNGNISFRGYTGIRIGLELSCESTVPAANRYDCSNTNSTQWAWPLGIQIGKRNANGLVVAFDARYSYGLSNAFVTSGTWHQSWEFKVVIGKGN